MTFGERLIGKCCASDVQIVCLNCGELPLSCFCLVSSRNKVPVDESAEGSSEYANALCPSSLCLCLSQSVS